MSLWNWINERFELVEKVPARPVDGNLIEEWSGEFEEWYDSSGMQGLGLEAEELYLEAVNEGYDHRDAAFNLGLAGMDAYKRQEDVEQNDWFLRIEEGAASAILKETGSEEGVEMMELVRDGFDQYHRLEDQNYFSEL